MPDVWRRLAEQDDELLRWSYNEINEVKNWTHHSQQGQYISILGWFQSRPAGLGGRAH